VVINLHNKVQHVSCLGESVTHAMRKLQVAPVPTRTKLARSSWTARARRVNLLNFSFARGTRSKKRDKKIPVIDRKRAKPVNPA
jgi:hypothetical protein